jgi:hypothetical protein
MDIPFLVLGLVIGFVLGLLTAAAFFIWLLPSIVEEVKSWCQPRRRPDR